MNTSIENIADTFKDGKYKNEFTHLLTLIALHKPKDILDYCASFDDQTRYDAIQLLNMIEEEHYHPWVSAKDMYSTTKGSKVQYNHYYALVCCIHTFDDFKRAKPIYNFKHPYDVFFIYDEYKDLLAYLKRITPNPDDMLKIFIALEKDKEEWNGHLNFIIVWESYKSGYLAFDEALFVCCYGQHYFEFDKDMINISGAEYICKNPDIINKVILPSYKYQDSFFRNNLSFTKEALEIATEKNIHFDQSSIKDILKTLLNVWDKRSLDGRCRFIEYLKPSKNELLDCQYNLFAVINTGNSSLINFAFKQIKKIYKEKSFDMVEFYSCYTTIITQEKCKSSIITGLDILAYSFGENTLNKISKQDIAEQLAMIFIHHDIKLQEACAKFFTEYFAHDDVYQIILPYMQNIKPSIQEQLNTLNQDNHHSSSLDIENKITDNDVIPIYPNINELMTMTIADDWQALLFQIGDSIENDNTVMIEKVFEGIHQLYYKFPSDWVSQIEPYLKSLELNHLSYRCRGLLYVALMVLSKRKQLEIPNDYQYNYSEYYNICQQEYIEDKEIDKEWEKNYEFYLYLKQDMDYAPFLYKKLQALIKKCQENHKLPFLSTPTHAPFYICPDVFLDRLIAYEQANICPDIDDLIIACNRLYISAINDKHQEKVKQLKGDYRQAIAYYYGVHNDIMLDDIYLPLWVQIARNKNINGVFNQFSKTAAKNIPTAIHPFYLSLDMNHRGEYNINFFVANVSEVPEFYQSNQEICVDKKKKLPQYSNQYINENVIGYNDIYYQTATIKLPKVFYEQDICYYFSLAPHYSEALLCRYLYDGFFGMTKTDSEYRDLHLYPMQIITKYQLPIYHSGWIYIAVSLFYDHRNIRDLAYEYILWAAQTDIQMNYFIDCSAFLLLNQFAPVNRFIEYLDKSMDHHHLLKINYEIMSKFIQKLDKQNLPKGYKNIIRYHQEYAEKLKIKITEDILAKVNELIQNKRKK